MKILVCGDRDYTDQEKIFSILKEYPQDTEIIHGCAKGADSLAALSAQKLNFKIFPFPANWDLYGRAAGPIRNRQMLKFKPDLVLAFHDDLAQSKGTKNMIKMARDAKVKCIIYGKTVITMD